MEVIKDGREKTFIKTCNNCRSDLRWSQEDIFETYKFGKTMELIVCPVCNEHIPIRLK
jgi:hypothetical protein